MSSIGSYAIIFIVCFIIVFGFLKKVPVFEAFVNGAKKGINTTLSIFPTLLGLIAAINMFKTSGALDMISNFCNPVMSALNIPTELLPLMLLRPISGSGALALCDSLFGNIHPDSITGKMISVMMGSSETTFYAIAVYFGSVNIRKTRHTAICAVAADLTCYIMAVTIINLSLFS